jgi:hypothetical protein
MVLLEIRELAAQLALMVHKVQLVAMVEKVQVVEKVQLAHKGCKV